ncbi:MAG: thioredoxin family protein [Candidatus Dormibacteraeota bacterium]|nr:thioredoxin family protein [Candidatus Dormibacteraeota bacterium]
MTDVSADELERTLGEEDRLLLVDFWHPSCEPCRELRRQLESLEDEACLLLALDASRHPLAAARHRVSDFPTVVFFKRGVELHRFKGGALPPSTLALLGSQSAS